MEPTNGRDEADSTTELLLRAARSLRHRWMEASAGSGLAPHQVRALRILAEGAVRPSALAARLRVTRRSATEVVDALEAAGLAERRPDPSDRRATLVSLTDRGTRVSTEVLETRRRASQAWLGRISPTEAAELHRLLAVLAEVDSDEGSCAPRRGR